MRVGVVVFPGSNCDTDCLYALREVVGCDAGPVWHDETDLTAFDAIVLPGGFSYGDYLRSGAIARFSPVMEAVRDLADAGKPVMGICNGFQVLLEAGLLPGAMRRNENLHFICGPAYLRVENSRTPFTSECRPGQVLELPIAHMEGNYYIDDAGLRGLTRNNQIVLRYCTPGGKTDPAGNPNGSVDAIAGIVNERGNVFGLMPHPERACEKMLGTDDGLYILRSLVSYLESGRGRCSA